VGPPKKKQVSTHLLINQESLNAKPKNSKHPLFNRWGEPRPSKKNPCYSLKRSYCYSTVGTILRNDFYICIYTHKSELHTHTHTHTNTHTHQAEIKFKLVFAVEQEPNNVSLSLSLSLSL
jgi:hypothetical protein